MVILAIGIISCFAGAAGIVYQRRRPNRRESASASPIGQEAEVPFAADRIPSNEVRQYLTTLKNSCKGSSAAFRESQAMDLSSPYQAAVAWNTALVDGTENAEI